MSEKALKFAAEAQTWYQKTFKFDLGPSFRKIK